MTYETPTAINPNNQPLVNQLCGECRAYIAASRAAPIPDAFSLNIHQLFVPTGTPINYLASYFNNII
jgi:hypothetical protein